MSNKKPLYNRYRGMLNNFDVDFAFSLVFSQHF